MPIKKQWKETDFWKWFEDNQDLYFQLTPESEDLETALLDLDEALSRFSPELEFELNLEADQDGKKTFFISGGGVVAAFPKVETLGATAPESDKWKFVNYKQRKEQIGEIQLGEGMVFSMDNIFFSFQEDEPGKVGINLFFENFRENIEDLFGQVGFIFLDAILGEYDVATKVGKIQFLCKSKGEEKSMKATSSLRQDFDQYFSK